jgi:hypothetical protein
LRHCFDLAGTAFSNNLSGASPRTLDQYERDLRLVCLASGTGVKGVTHGDLMLVLELVPK